MRDGFDKDVYAISRVSENATVAQIKSAHRNLAKIVHPDRHPAASETSRASPTLSQRKVD